MNYLDTYNIWKSKHLEDPDLIAEMVDIEGNDHEIKERFVKMLEFGTAGLRGILGVGTNRMNIYTVALATQGMADYVKEKFENPSVAIAYDSRINSLLFAQTAAAVFASQGISVYLFARLMPTPALSFAVRHLDCRGGVVITASHNPAKYNGYKVYGADGGQITLEAAAAIQAKIDSLDVFDGEGLPSFAEMLAAGKIAYISAEVEAAYLRAVSGQSLLPAGADRSFSIVYTPLHGAGISCVPDCLRENGFTNILLPERQKEPDGNFPTCPYPNPEIREALKVGLDLARERGCELVLATDPDCDRVGAAILVDDKYQLINGNQMGVLLFDFICQRRIASGTMPKRPVAVKTIVTTEMARPLALHYGVELRDVLTGFKFIGEQIGLLEQTGEAERFIFGFEESYGYLSGSFARDKDAVNASLLICEMCAYYRQQGLTLLDVLNRLYAKFGAYNEKLLTFTFEGQQGAAKMADIMERLRQEPPERVLDWPVETFNDYLSGNTRWADGRKERINLPTSNVVQLRLESGALLTFRPSGTEPKLKIYLSATGTSPAETLEMGQALEKYCREWVEQG